MFCQFMKILVTGGAGFIGSHLVDSLLDLRHEVIILDNLSTGFGKNINSKAQFFKYDINNPHLKSIFEKEYIDVIYHLAAQIDVRKSVENPANDFKENIIGSLKMIELAKEHKAKFIFSSSGGAIYGETDDRPTKETHRENPKSPYGIAKLAIEKYLNFYHESFGLDYVALRYSNVYGPRQNSKGEAGVVAIFLSKMLKGEQPVINGDGTQTRDYVFVDDVVRANLLALDLPVGIYNVGTGIETDVNELFNKINSLFENKFEKKYSPAKKGEQKTSRLNYDKIREFGWAPTIFLNDGLRKTYEWFKEN